MKQNQRKSQFNCKRKYSVNLLHPSRSHSPQTMLQHLQDLRACKEQSILVPHEVWHCSLRLNGYCYFSNSLKSFKIAINWISFAILGKLQNINFYHFKIFILSLNLKRWKYPEKCKMAQFSRLIMIKRKISVEFYNLN